MKTKLITTSSFLFFIDEDKSKMKDGEHFHFRDRVYKYDSATYSAQPLCGKIIGYLPLTDITLPEGVLLPPLPEGKTNPTGFIPEQRYKDKYGYWYAYTDEAKRLLINVELCCLTETNDKGQSVLCGQYTF